MPALVSPILLTRDPRAGREDLATYVREGGYLALAKVLAGLTPERVCAEITSSGLSGRGGASFPTGRKWELARSAPAGPKHVVANGGEHEPGSRKDKVLLATHPHKVLEGMVIAGYATGAANGHLYLIEDMHEAREATGTAIAEARAAGHLGQNIHGSGFDFDVELTLAPPTYVAGEETAALEVIEGRPALPREKPPYPGSKGAFGRPTTVNNVETLAHVPAILRHSAAWFAAIGADGSAGSMLFTLDDAVAQPGVYELPFGATFRDLIEGCGGGLRAGATLRAILPALSSAFLPAAALDLQLTHGALRDAGSTLGCGGISLLVDGQCAVERVQEIAHFFMAEQCGQCPPCRMETNTIASVVDKVMVGEAGDYLAQIGKISSFAAGKGRCSLIEMAATPVLSALRLFPEDFAHHAAHGRCLR